MAEGEGCWGGLWSCVGLGDGEDGRVEAARTNDFLQGLVGAGPAGLLVIVIALGGMTYNAYAALVPQRRRWVWVVLACCGPLLIASIFAYCRIHAAYDAFDSHDFRRHWDAVSVSRTVLASVTVLSGLAAALGCWAIARSRRLGAEKDAYVHPADA